jgi:hypothetical protein
MFNEPDLIRKREKEKKEAKKRKREKRSKKEKKRKRGKTERRYKKKKIEMNLINIPSSGVRSRNLNNLKKK